MLSKIKWFIKMEVFWLKELDWLGRGVTTTTEGDARVCERSLLIGIGLVVSHSENREKLLKCNVYNAIAVTTLSLEYY